jgi:hypothetical protein
MWILILFDLMEGETRDEANEKKVLALLILALMMGIFPDVSWSSVSLRLGST